MASMVAFVGRTMFAFLFLTSALQQLQTFNFKTGGAALEFSQSKIDDFISKVEHLAHQKFHLPKEFFIYATAAYILMEIVGAVLFIFDSSLGAVLLLLFTVTVTPVMHSFWDAKEGSAEQLVEMVSFFKNLALVGAILFYVGGKPSKRKRD